MKAGRNTPQSVLRYIDAIWEQNTPPDPLVLARELGYKDSAFVRLKERHGDGLVRYLEGVRRQRTEKDRWMARQGGRYHPQQYVSSRHGAIDDDPAVDEFTQRRITENARQRERDAVGELLSAAEEFRSALSERMQSPEFAARAGRDAWLVRSKLDRMVRNLRRKAA